MSLEGRGLEASSGPAINTDAVMEIFSAPGGVEARIAAYVKAKTEADASLAALRLGNDIKAAWDAAQAKLQVVDGLKAKAEADAKAASDALAEAQAKAAQIVGEAQAKADKLMDDLRKAREDHLAMVDMTKADLATQRKVLNASINAFDKDKLRTKAAQDAAEKAKADAEAAADAHREAAEALKAKADALQEALGHVTAAR